MKKIILLLSLFALSGMLHSQNKKPVTKPDTLKVEKGDGINVLKNDRDPNGDPMKVSKLNGVAFQYGGSGQIIKKDTGVFTIDYKGNFSATFFDGFYGILTLTYYVNDNKAGAGKTEKIILSNPVLLFCPETFEKTDTAIYIWIMCERYTVKKFTADPSGHFYVEYMRGSSHVMSEITRPQYYYLTLKQ